jgi:hypothetical protein
MAHTGTGENSIYDFDNVDCLEHGTVLGNDRGNVLEKSGPNIAACPALS